MTKEVSNRDIYIITAGIRVNLGYGKNHYCIFLGGMDNLGHVSLLGFFAKYAHKK